MTLVFALVALGVLPDATVPTLANGPRVVLAFAERRAKVTGAGFAADTRLLVEVDLAAALPSSTCAPAHRRGVKTDAHGRFSVDLGSNGPCFYSCDIPFRAVVKDRHGAQTLARSDLVTRCWT
jgi:hypothetical protein